METNWAEGWECVSQSRGRKNLGTEEETKSLFLGLKPNENKILVLRQVDKREKCKGFGFHRVYSMDLRYTLT